MRVSKARISLLLEESFDLSNRVYLLVYCRYVYAGELKEEFLMCESLDTITKAFIVLEKWIISSNKIIYPRIMWVHFSQMVLVAKSGFTNLVKKSHPTLFLFTVLFIGMHWQVKPIKKDV